MKKCPFCGADIEDSARFCLYCMQSLTEKEQILLHEKKKPQWSMIIVAVVALVILVMLLLPKMLNPSTENPELSSVPSESTGNSTPTQTDPSTQPVTEPATQPVAEPATQPHVHLYSVQNTAIEYQKAEATCTQSAVYYYSCSCGEKGSESFYHGKKTEHTVVIDDPGYPVTCLTPGLSEASHCSVCQTVLSSQRELAARGHAYKSGGTTPACLNCGEIATVVIRSPELPFFQNDTFQIDGYNYNVEPSPTSDALWIIRLQINYTNVSSNTVTTSITAKVTGLEWFGNGWQHLAPNQSGAYSMNFENVPAGTYDLVFE